MNVTPRALIDVKELKLLRDFYHEHSNCRLSKNPAILDGGNPNDSVGSIDHIQDNESVSDSVTDHDCEVSPCTLDPNLADAPTEEVKEPSSPDLNKETIANPPLKVSVKDHDDKDNIDHSVLSVLWHKDRKKGARILKKLREKGLSIANDGQLYVNNELQPSLTIFELIKFLTTNNQRPLKLPEAKIRLYKTLISKLGLQHLIVNRHLKTNLDSGLSKTSWWFLEQIDK